MLNPDNLAQELEDAALLPSTLRKAYLLMDRETRRDVTLAMRRAERQAAAEEERRHRS